LLFCFRIYRQGRGIKSPRIGTEWKRQHLVIADDVNTLVESLNTINRNNETLLEASRETGLEEKAHKRECPRISSSECMTKS